MGNPGLTFKKQDVEHRLQPVQDLHLHPDGGHGSINTLSVKAADFVVAENSAGEKVEFNHPIFQANVMMLGEMLCMLAYIIYINFFTKDEPAKDAPKPNMFLFLPPALC